MKCHFDLCQKNAYPLWPYNNWGVPLCDKCASEMTRICPMPTSAEFQSKEFDITEYFMRVGLAVSHIRSDFEFDATAPDRRPELG